MQNAISGCGAWMWACRVAYSMPTPRCWKSHRFVASPPSESSMPAWSHRSRHRLQPSKSNQLRGRMVKLDVVLTLLLGFPLR